MKKHFFNSYPKKQVILTAIIAIYWTFLIVNWHEMDNIAHIVLTGSILVATFQYILDIQDIGKWAN